MHNRLLVLALALGLCGALASTALAQDPKFQYGDPKEVKDVKDVEWKASAQAGLVMTTGNSTTTAMSGGANASRKAGNDRFILLANGAYVRSTLIIVQDLNGDGVFQPDEITRLRQTTTKAWSLQGRYDRFLTEHGSVYGTAIVSADVPAGKELVIGGQIGYSRQLVKTAAHQVVTEAGYDYSHEELVLGDDQSIHSARLFVGYEGKLTAVTGLIGAAEVLANLNTLDSGASAFEDTRINASVALTTALFKDINLRFGVSAKYDHFPALNPVTALPAETLDTKTEAVLVVNFL